jgi:hypothetical protein
VPNTQTVTFGDPNGTLVLIDPSEFAAQINAVQPGDRIQDRQFAIGVIGGDCDMETARMGVLRILEDCSEISLSEDRHREPSAGEEGQPIRQIVPCPGGAEVVEPPSHHLNTFLRSLYGVSPPEQDRRGCQTLGEPLFAGQPYRGLGVLTRLLWLTPELVESRHKHQGRGQTRGIAGPPG